MLFRSHKSTARTFCRKTPAKDLIVIFGKVEDFFPKVPAELAPLPLPLSPATESRRGRRRTPPALRLSPSRSTTAAISAVAASPSSPIGACRDVAQRRESSPPCYATTAAKFHAGGDSGGLNVAAPPLRGPRANAHPPRPRSRPSTRGGAAGESPPSRHGRRGIHPL